MEQVKLERWIYKELTIDEITLNLFSGFDRYQQVHKCWRKDNQQWVLKDFSFIEQWNTTEYRSLVEDLKNTIRTGGIVMGVFDDEKLVGFASLENEYFGSKKEYLQLSSIHISKDSRGKGMGKSLFLLMGEKAKKMGAVKLYISAHSSEETQAFYRSLGCVEAMEYHEALVKKEPYDCQLEYLL